MDRRTLLRHGLVAGSAGIAAMLAPTRTALASPAMAGPGAHEVTHRVLGNLPAGRQVVTSAGEVVVSGLLTPGPLSAVSLDLPDGLDHAWVRSHGASGWSGWNRAGIEAATHGPDQVTGGQITGGEVAGAGRRVSHLLWCGRSDALQVATPAEAGLAGVRLHAVNTLDAGSEVTGDLLAPVWRLLRGQPSRLAPPRPQIVRRDQWRANESWRRGSPSYATPRRAILHHTAGGTGYSQQEAPAVVRAIYHYHTRVLGWSDVGYNLLVDRFGRIYEGRAGGVDRGVIGAHARGHNTGSFGVAVMGNFHNVRTNTAIREAVADLVAWKYHVHGIDPAPSRRVPHNGRSYPVLCGHRDTGRTVCPGQYLYGNLPRLREAVQARFSGT